MLAANQQKAMRYRYQMTLIVQQCLAFGCVPKDEKEAWFYWRKLYRKHKITPTDNNKGNT